MHSTASPKRWFVTGTDTDVGKTLIAAALLERARQQDHTTLGLKPVAAGCERVDGQWQNDDARLLRHTSTLVLPYEQHNPIALPDAIAPHIAAQRTGTELTLDALHQACQPALTAKVDTLVIEGAGGWQVPLNHAHTLADFAKRCHQQQPLTVLLVVAMRLGCINHARLSAEAIHTSGLSISGWVANHIQHDMHAQQENLDYLTRYFTDQRIPCLGHVPYLQHAPSIHTTLERDYERVQQVVGYLNG